MKRYEYNPADQNIKITPNEDGTVTILGERFKVRRRFRLITDKDRRVVMKASHRDQWVGPRPLFERILQYRKTKYSMEAIFTYELAE